MEETQPSETETPEEDTPHQGNRPTLLGMVFGFSQETSLHGVKFVLQENASVPRRLFWGAVMFMHFCCFLFVLVNQLNFISTRPVLTKVIAYYVDELSFPAITVCTRVDNSTHHSLSEFDNGVLYHFRSNNRTFFESMATEEYQKINLTDILRKRYLAQDESLTNCYFAKWDCMDLVQKVWADWGVCYTVNSVLPGDLVRDIGQSVNKDSPSSLISTGAGKMNPLVLSFNLRNTDRSGVQITFHQRDERITLLNTECLQLAPGTMNYIGLKMKQEKFLLPPYRAFGDRECMDTVAYNGHPLVSEGRYTLRACHDACYQKWAADICGCGIDMRGAMACTLKEILTCNRSTSIRFDSSFCDCPRPCENVIYEPALSWGPLNQLTRSERENTLAVTLYYDRLRIESSEQVRGYTDGQIFGSIGGQMGLFLGGSLVTLVEIAELMFRCFCQWICRSV